MQGEIGIIRVTPYSPKIGPLDLYLGGIVAFLIHSIHIPSDDCWVENAGSRGKATKYSNLSPITL